MSKIIYQQKVVDPSHLPVGVRENRIIAWGDGEVQFGDAADDMTELGCTVEDLRAVVAAYDQQRTNSEIEQGVQADAKWCGSAECPNNPGDIGTDELCNCKRTA